MPSEIEMRFVLPDKSAIERALEDEFLTRYLRDGFSKRDTFSEYHDTADWVLTENGYFLRTREVNGVRVATLKQGLIDVTAVPGLYNGRQWKCMFSGSETLAQSLMDRAAPDDFRKLTDGKELIPRFISRYTRYYATLYMPDMVRIELSFDSGEIRAENKTEAFYEMGFELLYGDTSSFLTFCSQVREHFGFNPSLLTKQQRALRLIRRR